jgi:hypothetical protein
MNITSVDQIQNYLAFKQIYFRKEVQDSNFNTFAKGGRVSEVGKVEVSKIRENCIALTLEINGEQTMIYNDMNEVEFVKFVTSLCVPVSVLVESYFNSK